MELAQPPSGGCVLKQAAILYDGRSNLQPPSGGCVLKPRSSRTRRQGRQPAAFRRLCVETRWPNHLSTGLTPAAFRRLCVETIMFHFTGEGLAQPPSGGCVLKQDGSLKQVVFDGQPPSGGCVLKQRGRGTRRAPAYQPPSGGCVLKQYVNWYEYAINSPSRLQAAVC